MIDNERLTSKELRKCCGIEPILYVCDTDEDPDCYNTITCSKCGNHIESGFLGQLIAEWDELISKELDAQKDENLDDKPSFHGCTFSNEHKNSWNLESARLSIDAQKGGDLGDKIKEINLVNSRLRKYLILAANLAPESTEPTGWIINYLINRPYSEIVQCKLGREIAPYFPQMLEIIEEQAKQLTATQKALDSAVEALKHIEDGAEYHNCPFRKQGAFNSGYALGWEQAGRLAEAARTGITFGTSVPQVVTDKQKLDRAVEALEVARNFLVVSTGVHRNIVLEKIDAALASIKE